MICKPCTPTSPNTSGPFQCFLIINSRLWSRQPLNSPHEVERYIRLLRRCLFIGLPISPLASKTLVIAFQKILDSYVIINWNATILVSESSLRPSYDSAQSIMSMRTRYWLLSCVQSTLHVI